MVYCLWFLIPEEIAILLFFLFGCSRDVDRFARVWIDTSVEHCGRQGHRRRREVLYLFRPIMHALGLLGQQNHIAVSTSRVRGDEIRDELLVQSRLFVDAQEEFTEAQIVTP